MNSKAMRFTPITQKLGFLGIQGLSTFLFLILISSSSCVSYDEILNFTEGPEFSELPTEIKNQAIIKIQSDDILSISVHTLDINAAAPFNGGIESTSLRAVTNRTSDDLNKGYLVDANGMIDFPVLGELKIGGLSIDEAKVVLVEKLQVYLKEPPIVNIRINNFKITILGEVNNPSSYIIDGEKITILEAIGLGGDLTNYGDRAEVMIVREEGNERIFGTVNLKDRNLFQSPFFYLKQNDFIYVRARKEKTASIRSQANIIVPWISAVVAVATLIVSVTR